MRCHIEYVVKDLLDIEIGDMLQVLEQGKPKEIKPWSLRRVSTGNGNDECGCRSKLLVEETDIYMTYHEHYWGETDSYFTFRCPVCNTHTDINENSIPYQVRDRIIERVENTKSLGRKRKYNDAGLER